MSLEPQPEKKKKPMKPTLGREIKKTRRAYLLSILEKKQAFGIELSTKDRAMKAALEVLDDEQ